MKTREKKRKQRKEEERKSELWQCRCRRRRYISRRREDLVTSKLLIRLFNEIISLLKTALGRVATDVLEPVLVKIYNVSRQCNTPRIIIWVSDDSCVSDETVRHVTVHIEPLPFLNAVSRNKELKRNPGVHVNDEEKKKVEIIERF